MTHTDHKRPASEPSESVFPWGKISLRPDHLLAVLELFPDEETARDAVRRIDDALVASGLRRLILDSRLLLPPTPSINQMFWEWAEAGTHHERLALVVTSDMKRVQGNMGAVAKRLQLRSFHVPDEAEKWLRRL